MSQLGSFGESITGWNARHTANLNTVGCIFSRLFVSTDCQPIFLIFHTFIIRFCKDAFDKNYKATIGVDFEMERFEVLGVPFSLQL